jgi:hypothetical protein
MAEDGYVYVTPWGDIMRTGRFDPPPPRNVELVVHNVEQRLKPIEEAATAAMLLFGEGMRSSFFEGACRGWLRQALSELEENETPTGVVAAIAAQTEPLRIDLGPSRPPPTRR